MRNALAVLLLRIGLGGVFFWFGFDKYHDPHAWYSWVPLVIQNRLPVSLDQFLQFQGIAEMVLGTALILGFLTRLACLACGCFILGVIHYMGLNQAMIRDLALFAVCLSLLVSGPGSASFDQLFFSRRKQ